MLLKVKLQGQFTTFIVLLTAVIITGTYLRLNNLTAKSIGHVEMYVPGLQLPADISIPAPRSTIRDIITGVVFDQEPNPPGYYLFMYMWNKIFKTNIFFLRLPSVIFGLSSILLVFFIGNIEHNKWIGLVASIMIALNGHQIYWSQIAKMYMMGGVLGLLSTLSLLLLVRSKSKRILLTVIYISFTLAGLGTVVYFWFLFAFQILWITINFCFKKASFPGLVRTQILLFILAMPLFSLAIFQAGRESYLSPDFLSGLAQYLEFGFLFETDYNAITSDTYPIFLGGISIVIALPILVIGLTSQTKQKNQNDELIDVTGPPLWVMYLAGAISFLLTLRLAKFTSGLDQSRTMLVAMVGIFALLLPYFDWLLIKYWKKLQMRNINWERGNLHVLIQLPLTAWLALGPIIIIVILSLYIPLFASRTIMLFTPYLLIVLSSGLVYLVQNNRIWIIFILIIGGLFVASISYYNEAILEFPHDYKGLVDKWIPRIEKNDAIIIQPHWATTPIFYYLREGDFQFISSEYSGGFQNVKNKRIWVLDIDGLDIEKNIDDVLADFQQKETLEALRIKAVLYTLDKYTP